MVQLKDMYINAEVSCANCENLNEKNYCKKRDQFVLIPKLSTCRVWEKRKPKESERE